MEYTHYYELSIIDIQNLCSGYINQLQLPYNIMNNIINNIQKYVRFELNVSSKNIDICGANGMKYEYLSINIEYNSTVCYKFPSHITCLHDCVICETSKLLLAKGTSVLNVINRLHIDNHSNIRNIRYGNNNKVQIICNNAMIINKSSIVTKI